MNVKLYYQAEAAAQELFATAYAAQAQACRVDPLSGEKNRLAGELFYLDIASKYRKRAAQYLAMANEV